MSPVRLCTTFVLVLLQTVSLFGIKHTLNSKNFNLTYEVKNDLDKGLYIEFDMFANTTGFVGIGISEDLSPFPRDIFHGTVLDESTMNLTIGLDFHIYYYSEQHYWNEADTSQDWFYDHFESGMQINSTTSFKVWRYLDTGDVKDDLVIQNKRMYVHWYYHDDDSITHNPKETGYWLVNLLDGSDPELPLPTPPPTTSTAEPETTTPSGAPVMKIFSTNVLLGVLLSLF